MTFGGITPNSARLVRLLSMVPYFQANPRITRDKAAADLGVSHDQLDKDLTQLWLCGLPGYGPGELIDFDFTGDTVEVVFSAGVDRPLRLTSPEATAVLVALQALAEIPGVVDPAAARSAIAKIEAAAGLAARAGTAGEGTAPAEGEAAAAVRRAVHTHRAVAIDYYAASRDALSHRIVDPIRVAVIGNHSYLEAWCREAEAVRLFRFDRIDAADVLDEPAVPPPVAQADTDTSLFDADPSLPTVTLRLAPSAAWMFDYYPMRLVSQLPDGASEVAMTYVSDEWLIRLLLGLGAEVQVLAPAPLAARVRDAAAAAVAAYQAVDAATKSSQPRLR